MSIEGIVGIDLGTTNSVMACINSRGQPEVIPKAEGKRITPSVVQIRQDGPALVGESAKQEIVIEKENTTLFFKRDMGTSTTYEYRGRAYSPTELSAKILKTLKADGQWAGQEDAERCAAECRRAGIEIIATGFGGADEALLRRIATSDQAALYSGGAQLVAAFGQIAQVLVENDASSEAARLSWLKRR